MFQKRNKHRRRPKVAKGLFMLTMMALFIIALGNVIMFLWNTILVEVTGVRPLTFWKAIGLFILTRILFGGFRFGPRGHKWGKRRKDWSKKWRSMNEEERAAFKAKWKKRYKGK